MDITRFTEGLDEIIVYSNFEKELLSNDFFIENTINIFDILNCSDDIKKKLKNSFNCITISLSPVSQINDSVDLIISRGFIQKHKNIRQIFGIEYSVIRGDISRINKNDYDKLINKRRLNLGISMGGSDPMNLSKLVIKEIKGISIPTTVWLALGSEYKNDINELFVEIKSSKYVDLVVGNVFEDLWLFLDKCQLVILQGGLTTTEAAFRGIPSINISKFVTQSEINRKLFESNSSWFIDKENIGQINNLILDKFRQKEILKKASLQSKKLIDGKGASRVKNEIFKLLNL